MSRYLWKDYLVELVEPHTSYYWFNFYEVYSWDNGTFSLVNNWEREPFTLDSFVDEENDVNFTILIRLTPGDSRFYTQELLLEEDTFDLLKEALQFCESIWKKVNK